jgi:hypothetical protein
LSRTTSAVLLALLLACGAAQAAEWVPIGKNDREESFLDVSSIRIADGTRRAWTKRVFALQTIKGDGADADKWWDYIVARVAFNCDQETSRGESIIVYFSDGTNRSYPRESSWDPVPPDTFFSLEMKFICAWKQK